MLDVNHRLVSDQFSEDLFDEGIVAERFPVIDAEKFHGKAEERKRAEG